MVPGGDPAGVRFRSFLRHAMSGSLGLAVIVPLHAK
jgi:hypothetical protein